MSELMWPTVDELRTANGLGREIEFEKAKVERDLVLFNWRNNIYTVLVDTVENKWQDTEISVPAPTQDKALARTIAPILVAWLQGVLPGMRVSVEPGEFYTSISIRWDNL